MLKRVLIANRGEIACRIMRTAERLGVETIAVFSDADRDARHVALADQAVHIGPSPATESYLNIARVIAAAKGAGADSIHPGYGFLSENDAFAAAVADAGLAFIGPTADAMRALGSKSAAKEIAERARVPVIPGYRGADQAPAALKTAADGIGYPLMIKAVAGGGGRGMRLVTEASQFADALESARREALSAFGNADVLLERAIQAPRHVEVQVFGDTHGNVIHLFERDCTLQRRNQKVIEEAPAPGMSPALREAMCSAAVRLAKEVGYTGAGTVEFLVEGGKLDERARWSFIEMNTRLQVEHPVTEAITGLDLVALQFRIAAGEAIPLAQDEIVMTGHAVEARLCAEDPAAGFQPAIGTLAAFEMPADPRVRVETGVEAGSDVSPFYDSMITKLIVHEDTRDAALDGLAQALDTSVVLGLPTNARFLRALLRDGDVRSNTMDTELITAKLDDLARAPLTKASLEVGLDVLFDADTAPAPGPWAARDAFQLGSPRQETRDIVINGASRSIAFQWDDGAPVVHSVDGATTDDVGGEAAVAVHRDGGTVFVLADLVHTSFSLPLVEALDDDDDAASGEIRAPINGRVVKVFAAAGDTVADGDRIMVIEAMKMEHVLTTGAAGVVAGIAVAEGDQVAERQVLATIDTGGDAEGAETA
ncbi:MAG: biotin carboxylase N-terminal domain-containing protein [Pseudomonadota bacterium]